MSADAPVTLPAIAFLGAGSMARAILSGLLQPGIEIDGGIRATNRSPERAAELDGLPGVTVVRDRGGCRGEPHGGRRSASSWSSRVKPAMVPDLLREIADALEPGTIVVSVAAGVTVATFESLLPESVAVIRSMPNTPAVVGPRRHRASRRAPARPATTSRSPCALFETVGDVIVVPEEQIVEEREDQDEGGRLQDGEAVRPSEPLGLDEGVHEVHHGGDTQRGGEEFEEDHSFSTPFAMRPTTTNTAMIAAT